MAGAGEEASAVASDKKKSRLAALDRKHTTSPTPTAASSPIVASSGSPSSSRALQASTSSSFRSPGSFNTKPDPNDKSYAKLCTSVINGPLASELQLRRDNANFVVDAMIRDLLASNAKTAAGNIGGTIENRVLDRQLLLDNPATQGGAIDRAKERAHRARSRRSSKHMSMREHRKTGSFDLPPEYQKYNLYLPIHEMWKDYVKSVVADCNEAMIQSRLLSADLHGAILAVVESKSTSYIGTQGIMIRETDNTFGIMTSNDKFRVVPKAGTVFMFQLDSSRVTLFGNNLFSRRLHPAKRQQTKQTIEL